MSGKKVEFGGRDAEGREAVAEKQDAAARAAVERHDRVSRLIASSDFREWFYEVMDGLCGPDFGLTACDEFVMGKRASASFLKQSLMIGDGSAKFIGEITERYFKAEHEAIMSAYRQTIGNDR